MHGPWVMGIGDLGFFEVLLIGELHRGGISFHNCFLMPEMVNNNNNSKRRV